MSAVDFRPCSGTLPLAEAQREIASDWYAVYERIPRGRQGNGGKGSNSEVVYVSGKASHCDQ